MSLLLAASLITVKLAASVCFDPCDMTLILTVEKAKDNQKVRLELIEDNGNYYRLSEPDYGETSPRTVRITYKGVPAGNYVLRAILYKHDGRTWIAGEDSKRFKVIGEGEL